MKNIYEFYKVLAVSCCMCFACACSAHIKEANEFYLKGTKAFDAGTKDSIIVAFENFKHSAELGNAEAMLMLARCYSRGLGVTINPTKAKYWYERATENDISSANIEMLEQYGDYSFEDLMNSVEGGNYNLLSYLLPHEERLKKYRDLYSKALADNYQFTPGRLLSIAINLDIELTEKQLGLLDKSQQYKLLAIQSATAEEEFYNLLAMTKQGNYEFWARLKELSVKLNREDEIIDLWIPPYFENWTVCPKNRAVQKLIRQLN